MSKVNLDKLIVDSFIRPPENVVTWFEDIKKIPLEETITWFVDKESIYDSGANRFAEVTIDDQHKSYQPLTDYFIKDTKIHVDYEQDTTDPDSNKKHVEWNEVLIMPDGTVTRPLRQYCKFVIVEDPRMKITEYTGSKYLPFDSITNDEFNVVATAGRDFSYEAVRQENVPIIEEAITSGTKLDIEKFDCSNILGGLRMIRELGYGPSPILLCNPNQIRDLILDPNLDSYIGFSRPGIITESVVSKILGIGIHNCDTPNDRAVMLMSHSSITIGVKRNVKITAQKKDYGVKLTAMHGIIAKANHPGSIINLRLNSI